MSGSNNLDFHFVDLDGELTGTDRQPAAASDHRSLSINRSSVMRLIATREFPNTGEPVAATTPSEAPMQPASLEPLPSPRFDSAALAVDYSLPPAEPLPEPQPTEEASEQVLVTLEPADEDAADEPAQPVAESARDALPEREELPQAVVEVLTEAEPESQAEPEPSAAPEPDSEPPQPVTEESVTAVVARPEPDTSLGSETDSVLSDVQHTLDALAEMAKGLTQQKLDALRQHEGLEQRRAQIVEKERQLAEKEEQLRLLETRLAQEVANLERSAEDSARALAERSAALKALAENVEARDRSTSKLADNLRQEKQRNDELTELLQRRAATLDEREAALNRRDDELAEKLKQLIGAKDRFRGLVKSFNETVQFNDTLNAISLAPLDD